jgi:hypothetical protein
VVSESSDPVDGDSSQQESLVSSHLPSSSGYSSASASVVSQSVDHVNGDSRQRRSGTSLYPLPYIATSSSAFGSYSVKMSARVIITFAYAGIEPPIYVVTSASSPPWEVLEMNTSTELTKEGDNIYYLVLDGVAPGVYQYKVRAGNGTWIVDGSKETGKPLTPPSTHDCNVGGTLAAWRASPKWAVLTACTCLSSLSHPHCTLHPLPMGLRQCAAGVSRTSRCQHVSSGRRILRSRLGAIH